VSGTYTGSLGAGESIQVSADGGANWVTASASAGTFSASGVTLSSGANALSVRTIDTAGNTTAGTGHNYTLDTVADTAPTASVTINDVDGYINNSEKAAVSYTVANVDGDATASVTFSSTGGGTPVVVNNLGNGTTTVDLSGLRGRRRSLRLAAS